MFNDNAEINDLAYMIIEEPQSSEMTSSRSTGVIDESSTSNQFAELTEGELLKKLDIAEQKSKFFREKSAAGGNLFNEMNRILEYIAVNAIAILSPGIISQESVSDILKNNPGNYLQKSLSVQLFGKCYPPYCVEFIKTGRDSSNLFLSFLYNTIQYTKEFRNLKEDVLNGHENQYEVSRRLMSLICEYGLNNLHTIVIYPNDFNDHNVSARYEFDRSTSKRFYTSCQDVDCNYKNSFSLWPFNEFVPVIVDSDGFPAYYLTGLFINHFSGLLNPVKRVKIDSKESVKLEVKQLREALERSAKSVS